MALSDRINNKFEEWRQDITHGLAGFMVTMLGKGIDVFMNIFEEGIRPVIKPTIDKILENPETPEEVKSLLRDAMVVPGAWPALVLGMMGTMAGGAALGASMVPPLEHLKQAISAKDPFQPFDFPFVLAAWLRGLEFPEDIFQDLRRRGWSDERIEIFKKLAYLPLDYRDVQSIWVRDKVKYDKWLNDLKIAGWSEDRIEAIKELAHIVPPVGDMVRFADFGSFDPAIIEMWREFYDAPDWIKEPMGKAGIAGDWADKYWFSHWQQPGRFELGLMRHRDLIDDETVKKAYLTQGYTTFWQDHLLELTKELYTRVDIRRMYKVGVLDRDGVYKANRDLGYDHEKATNLTEFTLKYYARPEEAVEEEEEKIRELTRADICDGYRRAILTDAECTELLGKLAYEPESVQFYLDREDLKRDQALKDAYAANYRRLYVIGIKDDATAKTEMVDLGFLDTEVDELLKLWYIEKIRREAKPSRTDLTGFLKNGTISEDRWRAEMASLGYADEYIELYFRDIEERPSRVDLTRFLKKEIITEDRWRAEMAALAYADECIEWYLQDTKA